MRGEPKRKAYVGHRWRTLRAQVLAASTVCGICGKPGAGTVDHIVPVNRGGDPYDLANLQPAHARCNYRKGDRMPKPPTTRPSRDW